MGRRPYYATSSIGGPYGECLISFQPEGRLSLHARPRRIGIATSRAIWQMRDDEIDAISEARDDRCITLVIAAGYLDMVKGLDRYRCTTRNVAARNRAEIGDRRDAVQRTSRVAAYGKLFQQRERRPLPVLRRMPVR